MVSGDSLGRSGIGLSGFSLHWFLGIGFRWDSDAVRTVLGKLVFSTVVSHGLICNCSHWCGLHTAEDLKRCLIK
jgi:hypothetical protein